MEEVTRASNGVTDALHAPKGFADALRSDRVKKHARPGDTDGLIPIRENHLAPTPKGAAVSKRDKYDWNQPGRRGVFYWLPKTSLYVDPSYQRDVKSRSRVVRIAREWEWYRCGTLLVVCRPNGVYTVVDGQNRALAAALRDDIEELPCMVFHWDDLTAEAKAFVLLNTTRTNANAYERHHANVTAGDPIALAAQDIVERYGYRFTPDSGSNWSCNAVARVNRMVGIDQKLADQVFGLAAQVADGKAVKDNVLMGLFWIAQRDLSVFEPVHRTRLIEEGIESVELEIDRHRRILNKGGEKVCGQAIAALLNKGRRSNKVDV